MGQVADDMLDGSCCSICGQYFEHEKSTEDKPIIHEHGYPVVCFDCWDEDLEQDHIKAVVHTF